MAILPPRAHGVSTYETLDQKTGLRRPPTVVGHSLARVRRGAEARNNRFELAPSGRVLFVAQSHRARVELKADLILADPPFNISDWAGERLRDDERWQYGAPPAGNANFAWVQHIVDHGAASGSSGARTTRRSGVV